MKLVDQHRAVSSSPYNDGTNVYTVSNCFAIFSKLASSSCIDCQSVQQNPEDVRHNILQNTAHYSVRTVDITLHTLNSPIESSMGSTLV